MESEEEEKTEGEEGLRGRKDKTIKARGGCRVKKGCVCGQGGMLVGLLQFREGRGE